MFGIGLPELILIMVVALIVVGPEKLPELAKSLAKGIVELKKAANSLKDSLQEEDKPEWKPLSPEAEADKTTPQPPLPRDTPGGSAAEPSAPSTPAAPSAPAPSPAETSASTGKENSPAS